MAGHIGQVGRRGAAVLADARVGAGRQEQLDHLIVAVLRGRMQRSHPAVLRRGDVGAGGQQQPTDLDVATRGRSVEWLVGELVAPTEVGRGAGVEQPAGRLGLAEECGEVQRREAVARQRGDAPGILVEPGLQAIDVPERGSVEHVHVRIGREQRVEDRSIGPVSRMEERGHAVGPAGAGQRRVDGQQRRYSRPVTRLDRQEQLVGGHRASVHPGRRAA